MRSSQVRPEDDQPLVEVRVVSVHLAKRLKNSKVYIGFTSKDPKIWIQEHNQGSDAWSRENSPFRLVYFETFVLRTDALRREKFF